MSQRYSVARKRRSRVDVFLIRCVRYYISCHQHRTRRNTDALFAGCWAPGALPHLFRCIYRMVRPRVISFGAILQKSVSLLTSKTRLTPVMPTLLAGHTYIEPNPQPHHRIVRSRLQRRLSGGPRPRGAYPQRVVWSPWRRGSTRSARKPRQPGQSGWLWRSVGPPSRRPSRRSGPLRYGRVYAQRPRLYV